jgi:hypothetical protein
MGGKADLRRLPNIRCMQRPLKRLFAFLQLKLFGVESPKERKGREGTIFTKPKRARASRSEI